MNKTTKTASCLLAPAIAVSLLLTAPAAQAGHGGAVAAGIFGLAAVATAATIAANTPPPPPPTVVYAPQPAVVEYVTPGVSVQYVHTAPVVHYAPPPPPPPPRFHHRPPPPPHRPIGRPRR